jgi:drug/metabolite transporter (DMT)-like permease
MITSTFAFSWMAICTNLAGKGCDWQSVALVRSAVPLILVAVWAWYDGVRLVLWGPPSLWLRSIAGSLSLIGSFYAMTHMSPAEANSIASTFPIWVAILSWPLLGQIPSRPVWISACCGVVGVALVQGPQLGTLNPIALVAFGVSVCSALAMMGLHRLKHLDPRAVVVHFSAVSTVLCLGLLLVVPAESTVDAFAPHHAMLLLGVGVLATIGQFFLTRAFTAGSPARVSVVGLTQVVFVLALEAALLGNIPGEVKLTGVLLIVAPTAWIILRKPARRRAPVAKTAQAPG